MPIPSTTPPVGDRIAAGGIGLLKERSVSPQAQGFTRDVAPGTAVGYPSGCDHENVAFGRRIPQTCPSVLPLRHQDNWTLHFVSGIFPPPIISAHIQDNSFVPFTLAPPPRLRLAEWPLLMDCLSSATTGLLFSKNLHFYAVLMFFPPPYFLSFVVRSTC